MINLRISALLAPLLLAGCLSNPSIPVSGQQPLVMESTMLAAGITAEEPEIANSETQISAQSRLYNEKNVPLTVHYLFYWYDGSGLELHPLQIPGEVTVPAHSSVMISGMANDLAAKKVRLYLYL